MNNLIQDCQEILVEFGFTRRWAEVEMWHSIGKRICEEKDFKLKDMEPLADTLEIDESEIRDAVLFFKKFPDLTMFVSGKDTSWNKIKEIYLE